MSADHPSGVLALPSGHRGRLLIEIVPEAGGQAAPVTVAVRPEGAGGKAQHFSLYPPDRPGRFALRDSDGWAAVTVSIEGSAARVKPLTIRAIAMPK